jgi:ribosomal protein L7/L12
MFGFNDSARRIHRLEAQMAAHEQTIAQLCEKLGIEPTRSSAPTIDATGAPLADEEKRLLGEGKKIAAIKAYRERTGANLVDAKEAVEGGL